MTNAPTTKLLLSAMIIALAGGCATARPELAARSRLACVRKGGPQFVANACLLVHGQSPKARASSSSPQIWVGLFSPDRSLADLGLWQVTVLRDGKVVSRGHFLNMPHDQIRPPFLNKAMQGYGHGTYDRVRIPAIQWRPGTYLLQLTWGPNPAQHVVFHIEVAPGSGAPGSEEALPAGEMMVKA